MSTNKFVIGYRYSIYETTNNIQNNIKINLVIASVRHKQITSDYLLYFCFDNHVKEKLETLMKKCNNIQELNNKIIWMKEKYFDSYEEANLFGKQTWDEVITEHNEQVFNNLVDNLDTSPFNAHNWV
jgi:hypothetical protein